MLLVHPSLISRIDKYASDSLGIFTHTLMGRAGRAVENAVRECSELGARVSIFAGKGNNGGDGYAAALYLLEDYDVTVYDVFSAGQRSDEGKSFLAEYAASGGRIEPLTFDENQVLDIAKSAVVVDAVFGTGFCGALPEIALKLAKLIGSLDGVCRIAVDVPLGVDAALGAVDFEVVYRADATVVLGFVKTGLVSYPAKEYVGKLIYDNLGLQKDEILRNFTVDSYCIDQEIARELLPQRAENSNKGSFGKLLMLTGSSRYPGAAHLSLEAALRSGVGYVTFMGEKELTDTLLPKLPEAIYRTFSPTNASFDELAELITLSSSHSAILVGSGSSRSEGLFRLLECLLETNGAPLILDADAINVLSEHPDTAKRLISHSPRKVVLTPHPLELSRVSGIPTDIIQQNRLAVAKDFAREHSCILVLKGAGTVVTDGEVTYVNSSGSSALAKAGSGDVLAGHLAALVASGIDPLSASALAVYLHGRAADALSEELSDFGVIPSDLPREIARQISKISTSN